jgi:hypothetical protein
VAVVVGGVTRYDYARYFGAVLVALGAGVFALTYPPPLALGVQAVALAVAGVLHTLSGVATRVRDRVGPHRLLGVGNVVLGLSLVAGSAGDASGGSTELVYLAATVLGGGSLVFVGLSYVFWPHQFGLGADGYPIE